MPTYKLQRRQIWIETAPEWLLFIPRGLVPIVIAYKRNRFFGTIACT